MENIFEVQLMLGLSPDQIPLGKILCQVIKMGKYLEQIKPN